MTEDEARTKICHRTLGLTYKNPCIVGLCMAWQPVPEDTKIVKNKQVDAYKSVGYRVKEVHAITFTTMARGGNNEGYCADLRIDSSQTIITER